MYNILAPALSWHYMSVLSPLSSSEVNTCCQLLWFTILQVHTFQTSTQTYRRPPYICQVSDAQPKGVTSCTCGHICCHRFSRSVSQLDNSMQTPRLSNVVECASHQSLSSPGGLCNRTLYRMAHNRTVKKKTYTSCKSIT